MSPPRPRVRRAYPPPSLARLTCVERRPLGATGATVSRLGLGTLGWGRGVDPADADDMVRAFIDAGGSLIDTSDAHADGAVESLLGKVLSDPALRDAAFVVTRAGTGGHPRRPVDTSRQHLLASLDASLARLGTSHIDLWMLSAWDDATPIDETLDAMGVAVATGRVLYAGVAFPRGWQVGTAAVASARAPHHRSLAAVAVAYSLVDRDAEAEVIPGARAHDLGILACAPLGCGVLTGKYRHGTPPDSRGASEVLGPGVRRLLDDRGRRVVEGVVTAAQGLDVTAAEVALAWVRDRPGISTVIVGPRTIHQLRTAVQSDALVLPDEIRSVLDEVSMCDTGDHR